MLLDSVLMYTFVIFTFYNNKYNYYKIKVINDQNVALTRMKSVTLFETE